VSLVAARKPPGVIKSDAYDDAKREEARKKDSLEELQKRINAVIERDTKYAQESRAESEKRRKAALEERKQRAIKEIEREMK
jgi:hypothetical protein